MTSFQLDYKGLGEVLRSAEMQREMRRRAELVMARAVSTAPVYETGPHPGRYRNAFSVSSGVKNDKRAYGRVTNDSPEARPVEYGTKNNPRYRTLGKALDAARG